MREAERCTGVTNAVVGAADGAPVRAERAPPLMGWQGGEADSLGWFEKSVIQTALASVRLLLAIGKYDDLIDTAVVQFTDENHPLFQQQPRSVRAVRHTWQLGGTEHRRQMAEAVRRCRE
jgi:hypothetical protein